MRADSFLRYVLLQLTSGVVASDPNIMARCVMRTSRSDSDVVTGLEIWRQMAVTMAGLAETQVVTLLRQIMTLTEWNPEWSPGPYPQYGWDFPEEIPEKFGKTPETLSEC